ncbi:thioredoxin family protein [Pedobacter nyackensis]|uniref:thioredoxin family protein n=1 Tax=Pedobacter nyackensis TaxID=475255 RepID=UPI00292CB8CF|nr:thioredoxin domain-containing protein [Pedobacter nyackensis]
MKKYLYILICLVGSQLGTAYAQGITFQHSSLAEVKEMAKAKNKLIFIDFYTDWCGPCKMMSKEVFPQKEVGDFYNANFIAVKIDAEKGEGPAIAKQYGISGYPTLAYINYKGEVMHKFVGSTGVTEFIGHGKAALLPQGDYEKLKAGFAKSELSNDELYAYLLMVKTRGDEAAGDQVFDIYLEKVAKVDARTYDLIVNQVRNTDSKGFKYIEQHRDGFGAAVGKDKLDGYIKKLYLDEFQLKVWYKTYKTLSDYQHAKALLKTRVELSPKEELGFDTDFYLRAEDEDNYVLNAKKLVETYYYNDDLRISNVLGGGSRLVKSEKNLLIVKGWAERALALNNNFINNASLAMVYKSLKNKPMAIKYINISIAQCRQEKNGYDERAEMLKKEIEEAAY